jgi:hypothetical protein
MPSDRPTAPFGRRECQVVTARNDGGYRVFTLLDETGPEPLPGQFYMLITAPDWAGHGGRPYLPRAVSFARSTPGESGLRLEFII